MSPRQIAEQLEAYIRGGPDAPPPPWEEIWALYRRVKFTHKQVEAVPNTFYERPRLGMALIAGGQAKGDLKRAMSPVNLLGDFGRDYLNSQNHLRPDERLAAIQRLTGSVHEYARHNSAEGLEGLVVFLVGEAEKAQRFRREPTAIPARKFGLASALEGWFRSRSKSVIKAEADECRDWHEQALAQFAENEAFSGTSLFEVLAPSRLTAAQSEVARLKAAGWSDAEIAQELGLSAATVRVHLHDISQRLRSFAQDDAIRAPHKRR